MDLYARANTLFLKYNPCEPHPDGSCIRTRKDAHYAEKPSQRCCSQCQHHKEEGGCQAICLSCKLWVCSLISSKAFARDEYTQEILNPDLYEFIHELRTLQDAAYNEVQPWSGVREDLKDTLERLHRREECQSSDKTQILSTEESSATSMTQNHAA
jgi:hypothetical protein